MSTVSTVPSFLKSTGYASIPDTRFYVIPPHGSHAYVIRDRTSPTWLKTYADGDVARRECRKLNQNPPAAKPLFPVSDSAVRSTPEPLIRRATTEACWRCGELCPSDGRIDPLHCAKCRATANAAAVHAVAGLSDDALIELGAAVGDEIARRLGSAA